MLAAEPQLDLAVSAMASKGARFVVVGGFSVIANRFVRATKDIDFLVPDDAENDERVLAALASLDGVRVRDDVPLRSEHLLDQTHLRAMTRAGIIDIIRGGLPPLDYETVEERAMRGDYGDVEFAIASLSSVVGFKRLADRPQDRNDLLELEGIHGELPVEPIPGLDEQGG